VREKIRRRLGSGSTRLWAAIYLREGADRRKEGRQRKGRRSRALPSEMRGILNDLATSVRRRGGDEKAKKGGTEREKVGRGGKAGGGRIWKGLSLLLK